MNKKEQARINDIIELIENHRDDLEHLYDEYQTGFDAAFDDAGARQMLNRWVLRTGEEIAESIGQREATRFAREAKARWGGLSQFREHVGGLDAFLEALSRDVESFPERYPAAPPRPTREPEHANDGARLDVFLSYATTDKDQAKEIDTLLRRSGKKVFLAERSLAPGDDFEERIRQAIARSEETWVLVTPSSIQSDWVQLETAAAWGLQKRVVPILFRCAPEQMPRTLLRFQAVDFHKLLRRLQGPARR